MTENPDELRERLRQQRYVARIYGGLVLACHSLLTRAIAGPAIAYLVGSALSSQRRPRDVDVRIVMPDHAWEREFDLTTDLAFGQPRIDWPRPEEWWTYLATVSGYETFIAHACGERNIDLAVLPVSVFESLHTGEKEELTRKWPLGAVAPA